MEQIVMNLALQYAKSRGLSKITDKALEYAYETLGIESDEEGSYDGSGIYGMKNRFSPKNLMKTGARKFLSNAANKALSGSGSASSFTAGALPIMAGGLALGYYTNPLREGSFNYNPNLQGQLDYAKRRGFMDRNNSAGALRYNKNSVLGGQNAISGFGTNDYGKQLQKYKDKYGDTMSKERLDKLNTEIEDLTTNDFDEVDRFMKKQTGPTYSGMDSIGSGGDNKTSSPSKQSPGGGGAPSHSTRDLMAKGGDVPTRSRLTADNILHNKTKKSEVKQFTPPERTGILQKLFGIDTDKLYDQGFDSMNKYRERNPDNPTEVLQLAGGKLSNLRHGVSTSLLRDDILKKINPGSYEMKEAPPSMNFEELKMSEEGPNKAAKGVASLLAYLGAGANEIGPGFFSKETMEDLTANLLGLMKTDVYDTPEDKAAMLNDILENDTGGINTYLQSLAPKEKYQEDAMLFPPMRQDKMRDQDLLFMKAEEEYDEKIKNLGLGDMDG